MFILELHNRIDAETPKGGVFILLVTEFGTEASKVSTVIQNSGEIWEW